LPQCKTTRILSLAVLALGTSLFAQAQDIGEAEETPVEADDAAVTGGKTCYVSKLRFENQGAYQVLNFMVRAKDLPGYLSQGQSRTWNLDKFDLTPGVEVYLKYDLDQGDKFKSKNCKKDGTTLKYHPDGNTWSHWSKGTTKLKNRCRYRSNKCITSVD